MGSCKYVPAQNAVIWTIKQFPGGREFAMRAHFNLPSVQSEDAEGKPPIKVKFEIPYFTTSGLQVRYLKIIEKSGYQALPWVRYITKNGGKNTGSGLSVTGRRILTLSHSPPLLSSLPLQDYEVRTA